MIPLKPDGRIDLEHRVYFLKDAPGQSVIVAASDDGCYSIIRGDFAEVRSYSHSTTVRAISPHPVAPWLAIVDKGSGSLAVQTFDGEQLTKVWPPDLAKETPSWVEPGFGDCYFDPSGEFLWLVAPRNTDEGEIFLVETTNWSTVATAVINDPFGGSHCSFHETGVPGLTVLWQAAGQDGQQVYWLRSNGGSFTCDEESQLRNTTPPVFSPSRDEFLVVTDDGAMVKYTFANDCPVGPGLAPDDEDDMFAESVADLNERRTLASTTKGRLILLDTESMTVVDEVSVEGADVTWFTKFGEVLLFVCRRDGGTGLKGWKDSLLWYSMKR